MQPHEIHARMQEIIGQHGDWTAHSIHLGHGIYTHNRVNEYYGDHITNNVYKLKRILQVVGDVAGKPLNQCRVLDLGCLEGMFAVEFALHGAKVIGVEGRESNLAKAQFAKEVLGLDDLHFILDDVRNLNEYGAFDIILCLGILYHLNAPDVFQFIESVYSSCNRVAVIDTHFAEEAKEIREHKGRPYQGLRSIEHLPEATIETKQLNRWASLDNNESFWFTKPSLLQLLSDVGFSSVLTIETPGFHMHRHNRDMFVALKGTQQLVRTHQACLLYSRESCQKQ